MKQNKIKYFITVVILFLLCADSHASRLDDIEGYVKKIRAAQKADHLYSSRYGLDKIFKQPDLSVEEQRELLKAYQILTDAFKAWSHYRNAADVYFDYLKLQEKYQNDYLIFLRDSLQRQNQAIETSENQRIKRLDSELETLRKEQGIVAGMKQKYYTFGGIALAVILVLFLFLFSSRNKAIRSSRAQLDENRKKILELYLKAAETSMLKGNIAFIRSLGSFGAEQIEAIESAQQTGSDWSQLKSLLGKLKDTQ
jgi:hypothetical protein